MARLPEPQPAENDRGIAESLGAILLISVIALGIAVFAVAFFSQQAAPILPSVTFNVTYGEDGSVSIRHQGGDTIPRDRLRVTIDDGTAVHDNEDLSEVDEGEDWTAWGIGDILVYDPPTSLSGPSKVLMVYADPSGGEYLMYLSEGEPSSFAKFVIDKNVFVHGTTLKFNGDNIYGPGATIILTGIGGLKAADIGSMGASIAISDIYINGDVTLGAGSVSLGSPTNPGHIYINGDLTLNTGLRSIYGDVYVNGNCDLEGVTIHDDVYVNGDLTLRRSDTVIAGDARIYYTGTPTALNHVSDSTLSKCIHQEAVPGFTMPDQKIPSTKPADWYTAKNYTSSGPLTDGVKIFADSYSYTPSGDLQAENVIVIAENGDIRIEKYGGLVTGVFFAPNGKVTFIGDSLEGVVIARDGLFINSWGTDVTFKNLEEYVSNSDDYPF
ncbi:MAG: hypothetical protein CVV31_00205 [Methanomicrobiales archaeon HGW-Methanomicrobiales-2]|jgi:hypothetical protein|nr:MAG: hypothetical protein CVV31_00205 [Methanomicrobiales archaeon HGW-Methanomicrobiales-2]